VRWHPGCCAWGRGFPHGDSAAMTRLALTLLSAAAATTASAQALAPGEEMVLGVSFLGVPAGEARVKVGQREGDLLPVVFQARTTGAARLLDVREHMVSYWDVARGASRGSDLQAYEMGDFHADSARFDRDGTTTRITVTERRGKRSEVTRLEAPADALDLTGAFVWLRLQELAVGRTFDVPIVSGTTQFTLRADVVAREEVRTPAGTYPAFKLRVRTGFEGTFSTRRDTFLWLADNGDRRLVRVSAEFAVGSIVGELKSYRPGAEVASR
jgi:hypothetical protein